MASFEKLSRVVIISNRGINRLYPDFILIKSSSIAVLDWYNSYSQTGCSVPMSIATLQSILWVFTILSSYQTKYIALRALIGIKRALIGTKTYTMYCANIKRHIYRYLIDMFMHRPHISYRTGFPWVFIIRASISGNCFMVESSQNNYKF